MISPRLIKLLLKHFDSIDAAVTARLVRKRPWHEPALTSLLCEYLDDEVEPDSPLSYPRSELTRDMACGEEAVTVKLRVDTHEYDSRIERYVTQSDLGLVIRVTDRFEVDRSFAIAWLLQAKRLFPESLNPLRYTASSVFESFNQEQKKRMDRLRERLKVDLLRYLLYCPRPATLEEGTRQELAYRRQSRLGGGIFDYTLGLQIRDELLSETSTLSAGIFTSACDDAPGTLRDVHSGILHTTSPLSWFIVSHLARGRYGVRDSMEGPHGRPMPFGAPAVVAIDSDGDLVNGHEPEHQASVVAHGVVTGNADVIREVVNKADIPGDGGFRFLPPHTVIIEIELGHPQQRASLR